MNHTVVVQGPSYPASNRPRSASLPARLRPAPTVTHDTAPHVARDCLTLARSASSNAVLRPSVLRPTMLRPATPQSAMSRQSDDAPHAADAGAQPPARRALHILMTNPMLHGTAFSVGAGVIAGVMTPLIALEATDLNVFPATCLLEAGAASFQWTLGFFVPQQGASIFPMNGTLAAMLGVTALFGGIGAPSTLVLGLKHTSAASVSLSENLEPFLTAAAAWALFRDRPNRYTLSAGALALVSGVLCAVGELRQAPTSGPGLGLAAASAACWAGLDICLYALRAKRPQHVVGFSTTVGAVIGAALAGVTGQTFPSGAQAAKVFGLGVAAFGIIDLLLSLSMRKLGASRSALMFSAVGLSTGVSVSCAMGQGRFTPLIGASLGVALIGSLVLASEHFRSQSSPVTAAATPLPPATVSANTAATHTALRTGDIV